MANKLEELFGALKATGGSPGTSKFSGKKKKTSSTPAVGRGGGKKRLAAAYQAEKK